MLSPDLLWKSQLVLAALMTGIIWQVQLLTYPQFLKITAADFVAYHRSHTKRMGWVVGPPMLAELGLALLTAWLLPSAHSYGALALVIAVWLTTALVQIPLHNRLARGYDDSAIRKLITTNWLRTFLWSARTVLLFCIVSATSPIAPASSISSNSAPTFHY